MSTDFILPDIGEGIVECEIVEWLVSEGDSIEEDQPVAEVSTDKAMVQIPSMYSGTVKKLYYAVGDIAKVHAPLFAISLADAAGANDATPTSAPRQGAEEMTPMASAEPAGSGNHADAANATAGKVLTTPAVRRIAREQALDLSKVPASGKHGRVLKEDVLSYLDGGGAETADARAGNSAAAPGRTASGRTAPGRTAPGRKEPIKGIRAVMARAMAESVSTIPHFTYVDEIDVTRLVALREKLKDQYAEQGIKLTMMPLFMKALSLALLEFPILNSQPNDDFSELHYLGSHNIGMAVDSRAGLLVPNAKGVEQLSIPELAQELARLIDAARSGRIDPADLKGGTITISNVGAVGGTVATPIINKPEVAIVALGKVQELPRFNRKGKVVARKLMTVSWSGDHRVIDGATMARFSNCWKAYLEEPNSMLMAMR